MASTMQLDFAQAMSDFKTMFPDMDRDVIEAVLRANQGAVDATIDQLLAMSTDNQNEKLRNEMDSSTSPQRSLINLHDDVDESVGNTRLPTDGTRFAGATTAIGAGGSTQLIDTSDVPDATTAANANAALLNIGATASPHHNTGASPKQRPPNKQQQPSQLLGHINSTPSKQQQQRSNGTRRWNPPMIGPLPPLFLRIQTASGTLDCSRDFDLPDEQFALMLQNEEFMNELRWNQEFMTALEKEQQDKAKGEDDAAFKERLKNMGKMSRKKFLQMARVFTWQRNKKVNTAKQIDSLPLKEEPSDDEDHHHQQQQQQQQQQQPQHQQQHQSQQVRK